MCDCAAQENHYRWLLPSTLHVLYFEGLHPRDLFCRRTYTYLQHQHELPGSLVFCLSWMLTTRLTFFMNLWQKCHRANLHCCHYTILSRRFLLKRSLDPGEISQSYPEWQLIYLGGSVCTAVKPLVAWAFDPVKSPAVRQCRQTMTNSRQSPREYSSECARKKEQAEWKINEAGLKIQRVRLNRMERLR